MEALPLADRIGTERSYLFWAVLLSLICLGLTFWSPNSLAFILGAVFVGLFLSNRTFRWAVFPTVLILDRFFLVALHVPSRVGGLALQPADWVAILLILSVFLNQVLTGRNRWAKTQLDRPIGLFLGATAISLFQAPALGAGIVNWGHMALYFAAFYSMVADWKDVPLERIWRVYFFWAVLAALSAAWQFFSSGGSRSLGFSGLALTGLVVPALCFELSHFTHRTEGARWITIAIFLLSALASQTRGLWINVGILLLVWFASRFLLKPVRAALGRRTAAQVIMLILVFVLIFLIAAPFFGQAERRAEQAIQGGGTVYLRLFLWGLAWQIFWEHPVTGIGMGQFADRVTQFHVLKNLDIFEEVRGLSAHSLIFSFLAETGAVGTLAFFGLLVSIVHLAWKGVQEARTPEELNCGWGLFLAFSTFVLSLPFLGVWGYHFTFFLALLVLYVKRLKTTEGQARGY